MAITTIRRDPFARQSIERLNVSQHGETCAWCGQAARWRYRIMPDGISYRPGAWSKPFCSIGCNREYNEP